MAAHTLLKLAHDLEWLGCELEHYGKKHALQGFPEEGPTWDVFVEKQQGVLATADKIERELTGVVRFNPTALVGVDYPLEATLDSITELLTAVEEIKQAARDAVHELPSRVRHFSRMVDGYLSEDHAMIG